MSIEVIRQKWEQGLWEITGHARRRMGLRKVSTEEIGHVIMTGEIIEDYPDDTPFPSCLIMGKIRDGFPLYVVCALSDQLHIITAHWLDPAKWLDPETRREKKL